MTNLDATTSVLAGPAELIQKKSAKIHDAAQQFEALMIGEMLFDLVFDLVHNSGTAWDAGNRPAAILLANVRCALLVHLQALRFEFFFRFFERRADGLQQTEPIRLRRR